MTGTATFRLMIAAALCATAAPAVAHPLAPALLEVAELAIAGRAEVLWRTPLLKPTGAAIEPVLPGECRTTLPPAVAEEGSSLAERWQVNCGTKSWIGRSVAVSGLAETRTTALVRVVLRDGRVLQGLLDGDTPSFTVPPEESQATLAARYARLGVEHLLGGFDHLLFVLALFLLATEARPLLVTLTAFTAGHSVTLSAAALGLVHVPAAPIELAIAASILLPAAQLASARRDAAGPRPAGLWGMAMGFGLLHGLGFAGALAEIGLPSGEIPLALGSFNAGIELGQIAAVGAFALAALAARTSGLAAAGASLRVPAYAIGSAAALLLWERAVPLIGG